MCLNAVTSLFYSWRYSSVCWEQMRVLSYALQLAQLYLQWIQLLHVSRNNACPWIFKCILCQLKRSYWTQLHTAKLKTEPFISSRKYCILLHKVRKQKFAFMLILVLIYFMLCVNIYSAWDGSYWGCYINDPEQCWTKDDILLYSYTFEPDPEESRVSSFSFAFTGFSFSEEVPKSKGFHWSESHFSSVQVLTSCMPSIHHLKTPF